VAILCLISLFLFAFQHNIRQWYNNTYKGGASVNPFPASFHTPTPVPTSVVLHVCVYNPDGVLVDTGLSPDNPKGFIICSYDGVGFVPVAGEAATGTPVPLATALPYWETPKP